MIYPETRGDYYNKNWNAVEYKNQLEIALDQTAYIGATEEGFVRLGLLGKIAQLIKRCFGGTDYSEMHRVQAAWLKFLYYGEAQGFLQTSDINQLQGRIRYSSEPIHPSVKTMFDDIEIFHQRYNQKAKPEHLEHLRDIITEYHQRHHSALLPGLWSRLFHPLKLDIKNLIHFGDTPLQLSEKALAQKEPDPALALHYLQIAFSLKNDSPEFQKKLAVQLDKLEKDPSPFFKTQKKTFQKFWIELAETALQQKMADLPKTYLQRALQTDPNSQSRLEIGKIYLRNKEYALVQPFLQELRTTYANDPQILLQIGDLYWDQGEHQEGIAVYETLLKLWEHSSNHSDKGRLYHRIGTAHMNGLIESASLPEAIRTLTAALKQDPSVAKYQEDASEAFSQQWKKSPDAFAADFGQEWEIVLQLLEDPVLTNPQYSIPQMLIGLSEQSFTALHNHKGRVYLEKLFLLFHRQPDLIIEGLNVAIRFHDSAHFEKRFQAWESEHYANPYLIEKIGEVYWDHDREIAIQKYERAIELFSKRHPICKGDEEKADCQRRMADLHAKIGEDHFQKKPEEAHQRLEKAFSLDPEKHGSALSKASLALAEAEKNRIFIMRDNEKIIAYLRRAFESHQQKGDYLIDLLQRCLNSKNPEDAATLYLDIQKQPWSNELVLPAKVYSQIAKLLKTQKNHEAAFICFKSAYEQEITNEEYKENYLKYPLRLAEKQLEKKNNESTIQILEEMARKLEECDKLCPDEERIKKMLGNIYWTLGKCIIQRCLYPKKKEGLDLEKVKKAILKVHQERFPLALEYYDKGLAHDPKNPCLHLDRAVYYEFWERDYNNAFEGYEAAVKLQERNPFYHRLLAFAYRIRWSDKEKFDHYKAKAEEIAGPDKEAFLRDFNLWNEEYFIKVKTREIDPHAYTQEKKGWLF